MPHTKESLIAFSKRVEAAFLAKRIAAPIHLAGGNEDQLIDIFQEVRPDDYVCSGWRSSYHALLKGMPEEEVFAEILAGRSMYLFSKEHRILCSSIVGGILPIACGLAMGIKRRKGSERVFAFLGDMTSYTGIYHEFREYCMSQALPVKIIIEDNGYSTNTPTEEAWGRGKYVAMKRYRYNRTWPHVGTGVHVSF